MKRPQAVAPAARPDGLTESERYLTQLCDRTFLRLWSYPRIFRDQDGGKEVADLLVVFGNHIIIFSDKACVLTATGNVHLDWSRWYRKAIAKSAKQVFGAERWIRDHPDRLFLDQTCTKPFPLALPDPAAAVVHRVVVAHGVAERCRREFGGSGSLRIIPDITGDMHSTRLEDEGHLFAVGQIDPASGYVHVLDDVSLEFVMAELDTVSDFVDYLSKKERLILEGRLESAPSEADLLAHYLFPVKGKLENGFMMPPGVDRLSIPEGLWTEFDRDPYRLLIQRANAVGYLWDDLIEMSSEDIIANRAYFASQPGVRAGAAAHQTLAGESRSRRRQIAIAFHDFVDDTPVLPNHYSYRIMRPTVSGQPYYVFLLLSPTLYGLTNVEYPEYREFRWNFLVGLCDVVKLQYPDAEDIVGIARELGGEVGHSQDWVYRNARSCTEVDLANAQRFASKHHIPVAAARPPAAGYDFAAQEGSPSRLPIIWNPLKAKGNVRNKLCLCGSGIKFKHCCGPRISQHVRNQNRSTVRRY